jgi:hypothetical protein
MDIYPRDEVGERVRHGFWIARWMGLYRGVDTAWDAAPLNPVDSLGHA